MFIQAGCKDIVGLEHLNLWQRLISESNLIEIQRIETATYSNKVYFPGEHFLYF